MGHSRTRLRCLSVVLVATTPVAATAQALYAEAGLGPTILFDQPTGAKTTYLGVCGGVGLEWRSPIGLRLEGTETYGFLWLSADVTYRFGARTLPLQPYALAGAGLRVELDRSDPIGTVGAGARAKLTGPLSLFGEGRVHHVLSSEPSLPPGGFGPRTFLLFTLGVSIASRSGTR